MSGVDRAALRAEIVSALARTAKYGHLSEETLHRMAAWALARHPDARGAVKAAKRKLHQVFGAYFGLADWEALESRMRALSPGIEGEALRGACRSILACHASTAERLPLLDRLFPALFRETGLPGSVLDLACGLNPFSLPWMGLGPAVAYRAWDLDRRLIQGVNTFLDCVGLPTGAVCRDLLVTGPPEPADVVFLFKVLPTLEQQERGSALRLLRTLQARFAVVSYPVKTLGGRNRGMDLHYDRQISRTLEVLGTTATRIPFPGEVFYVCRLPS